MSPLSGDYTESINAFININIFLKLNVLKNKQTG